MNKDNNLTSAIIEGAQDKKASSIVILDLHAIEGASTGKFIICNGKSTSQVSAIADNIREHVQKQCGIKPYNYDGYRNCQWIVIDYGDIMVHVFLPEYRSFYNLEDLWNDASMTAIKDID